MNTVTLLDANGAGGDESLRRALLNLFKDNIDSAVGPMTLKEFVMLHMLASLYDDGDFAAAQFWTTYPGHLGSLNAAMKDFLDIAAKLGRNKYRSDLLVRHMAAKRSNAARSLVASWEGVRSPGPTARSVAAVRVHSAS